MFSVLVKVFRKNRIVSAILRKGNVFLVNLLGVAAYATVRPIAVKILKFWIYWTFIRLLPSARTFIVISHINMTLVLKDNPVASSAPEPLRLKNIFPAKQRRSRHYFYKPAGNLERNGDCRLFTGEHGALISALGTRPVRFNLYGLIGYSNCFFRSLVLFFTSQVRKYQITQRPTEQRVFFAATQRTIPPRSSRYSTPTKPASTSI